MGSKAEANDMSSTVDPKDSFTLELDTGEYTQYKESDNYKVTPNIPRLLELIGNWLTQRYGDDEDAIKEVYGAKGPLNIIDFWSNLYVSNTVMVKVTGTSNYLQQKFESNCKMKYLWSII